MCICICVYIYHCLFQPATEPLPALALGAAKAHADSASQRLKSCKIVTGATLVWVLAILNPATLKCVHIKPYPNKHHISKKILPNMFPNIIFFIPLRVFWTHEFVNKLLYLKNPLKNPADRVPLSLAVTKKNSLVASKKEAEKSLVWDVMFVLVVFLFFEVSENISVLFEFFLKSASNTAKGVPLLWLALKQFFIVE